MEIALMLGYADVTFELTSLLEPWLGFRHQTDRARVLYKYMAGRYRPL